MGIESTRRSVDRWSGLLTSRDGRHQSGAAIFASRIQHSSACRSPMDGGPHPVVYPAYARFRHGWSTAKKDHEIPTHIRLKGAFLSMRPVAGSPA
jgi:hypothetical protein